jgi:hypothetical protein
VLCVHVDVGCSVLEALRVYCNHFHRILCIYPKQLYVLLFKFITSHHTLPSQAATAQAECDRIAASEKAAKDRISTIISDRSSLIKQLVDSGANTPEQIDKIVPDHTPLPLSATTETEIRDMPLAVDYVDPASSGTLRLNQIAARAHAVFNLPLARTLSALEDNETIRHLRADFYAEKQRQFDAEEAWKVRAHHLELVEKMHRLLPYAPGVAGLLADSPHLDKIAECMSRSVVNHTETMEDHVRGQENNNKVEAALAFIAEEYPGVVAEARAQFPASSQHVFFKATEDLYVKGKLELRKGSRKDDRTPQMDQMQLISLISTAVSTAVSTRPASYDMVYLEENKEQRAHEDKQRTHEKEHRAHEKEQREEQRAHEIQQREEQRAHEKEQRQEQRAHEKEQRTHDLVFDKQKADADTTRAVAQHAHEEKMEFLRKASEDDIPLQYHVKLTEKKAKSTKTKSGINNDALPPPYVTSLEKILEQAVTNVPRAATSKPKYALLVSRRSAVDALRMVYDGIVWIDTTKMIDTAVVALVLCESNIAMKRADDVLTVAVDGRYVSGVRRQLGGR